MKFTACPIFICCITIVPLWIETRTAYKWVINVRTRLYAVCLSSSTFSSVVHFRCRLHFWVQTLKGERFSGWILSVGGRFSPKRLAAWPFNFQGLMYYLRRRAKERGDWRNRETHISQLMIDQFQILPCNNEKYTVILLVHKKVVPLFQDELYINANHASM